mmetsp:Transcript_16567/g.24769  ORF Transcript_16567/g.24769 Transcript_16567/m.24769 type:complete len:705 (-) Transcript_16567:44-2158(-)|eukprot:CAMPEP_0203667358 /NCGR_PEP_ID=MMETSP0090-20130426/4198_1 /ASSEMBLY_ACC=CAM_ASM_001088 /TAXON_ID=426623 /ORGANISM="Chaetoceros affinis, Strain CCMP159" /LENGTH=704 /DNA_ID=CAMNT_0050531483 /DNA_START=36 /DNA_END=2150 /DNA_ORIENTATION=+
MATESIIGLQPPGSVTLTPNSNLLELILITERIRKVTLVGRYIKDHIGERQVLSAILFDDENIDLRVRDSPASSYSDMFKDNDIGRGDNYFKNNDYVQSLDLKKSPFVDEIVLQQTCISASDQPNLYWRQITYMKIQSGSQLIEIGEFRPTSASVPGKLLVLPEETVRGPCMISGVGMHNQDLLCLQIISVSTDSFKMYPPPEMPEHLYAYGKSTVGLVNLKSKDGKLKSVEETNFIGLESSDPDVFDVVHNLSEYMTDWYSSRSAIHRMFPDLYSLIDRSVTENDRSIIFAAFRLDRHLRWRIQNEVKNGHSFDRDPFIRLKVHKVVRCLAKTLERCQRLIVNKPSMDCYAIAYLSGNIRDVAIATLVLMTQIGLTYMLFMSILQDRDSGFQLFQRNERSIITPILAIFSGMLVYKQLSNVYATFKAYPKMSGSLMGAFDILANCVLGLIILVIQIIIIARTVDRVEYVLNSIAAIFILELDDNVVFFDDDGIKDLNRQLLMKDFRDRINAIDDVFFEVNNWRTARNSYQIIPQTCELKTLPPIQFTNSTRSMQSISSSQQPLEAVNIQFTEERQYNYALDGWAEVACSEPILSCKIKPDSKATLSFKWRDQGWGNRKGRMRIRLVNTENGDDVASTPEYGIAPHQYEEVTEHFSFNHGLVRNSAKGYKFVLEVVVGGGGGHELFMKDFSFICTSGLVAAECT